MLIYTGIGSRETPEEFQLLMVNIAARLADAGWTLRSGGANGADTAFECGAVEAGGAKEIYVPWMGFNSAPTKHPDYKVIQNKEAEQLAAQFHPAWDRCNRTARLMHTRNVYQVLGADLHTPTKMVICWTKDGKRGGGTGQALRIAEYLNIPIFDLAVCSLEEISDYAIEVMNHGS